MERNFAPYMEFVKTYQEMYGVNCPVPNFYQWFNSGYRINSGNINNNQPQMLLTNNNKINFSHNTISSSETVPKQNLPAEDTTKATENEPVAVKQIRDRWSDNEATLLVKLWRENIDKLQSTKCAEAWSHISEEVSKLNGGKNVKQCKVKVRNLKDLYKKAKDNNRKSGSSPDFPPFYDDFDTVLGCRDIIQLPDFEEVGVTDEVQTDPGLNNDEENRCKSSTVDGKKFNFVSFIYFMFLYCDLLYLSLDTEIISRQIETIP